MNRIPEQWQGPDPELEELRQFFEELDGDNSGNFTIRSGGMQTYAGMFGSSLVDVNFIVSIDPASEVLFLELGERAATRLLVDTFKIATIKHVTEHRQEMQEIERSLRLQLVDDE